MSKRLILVGAGDLAKEVAGWILSSDSTLLSKKEYCFIDDNVSKLTVADRSLKYLGSVQDFVPADGDELIAAVASPKVRSTLVDTLSRRGANFISYIHSSVVISIGVTIGRGVIMLPFSLVSVGSVIGEFSVVNCSSSVGHDVSIGSFVTISSHVDIMGHCIVEPEVFMGSGSRVLPGNRLGKSAVIGAGAVAVRSVASGKTLYLPLSRLL